MDIESYGQRPTGYRLPEASRIGAVRLQVADLERSVAFYTRTLGFQAAEQAQWHTVDVRDGLETLLVGVPDERLGRLEIRAPRGWTGQPLQRGGQALEALRQGGFVVHHRLAIFGRLSAFYLRWQGGCFYSAAKR